MKIIYQFLIIGFIAISINALAQEKALIVKNKNDKQISYAIKDGYKVEVYVHNRTKLVGRLQIANDSMIDVEDTLVRVTDIDRIKSRTYSKGLLYSGSALSALGVVGIGTSSAILVYAANSTEVYSEERLANCAISATCCFFSLLAIIPGLSMVLSQSYKTLDIDVRNSDFTLKIGEYIKLKKSIHSKRSHHQKLGDGN
jgi:hypothetical protein